MASEVRGASPRKRGRRGKRREALTDADIGAFVLLGMLPPYVLARAYQWSHWRSPLSEVTPPWTQTALSLILVACCLYYFWSPFVWRTPPVGSLVSAWVGVFCVIAVPFTNRGHAGLPILAAIAAPWWGGFLPHGIWLAWSDRLFRRARKGRGARSALARGVAAEGEGRLKAAVATFQEYLATKPKDWEALCSLGECQQDLGDLGSAEQSFRRCLEVNPESVEAAEGLALLWAERDKDYSRAISALEQPLSKVGEAGGGELVENSLAWVNYLKGDRQEAERHFAAFVAGAKGWRELGVEEDAQFAGLEYRAGALHLALKSDREQAREHLARAIQLSPQSVYAGQARGLLERAQRKS